MSSLEFPVLRDRDLTMRLHVPWHFQHDLSQDLKLAVDAEPLEWRIDGPIVTAALPKKAEASRPLQLRCRFKEPNVPSILVTVTTSAGSASP